MTTAKVDITLKGEKTDKIGMLVDFNDAKAWMNQILDRLEESLSPQGTACLLEATHQCMTCRGTAQSESRVTTFRARGVFERDPARRQELLAVLGKAASSGPGDDGS